MARKKQRRLLLSSHPVAVATEEDWRQSVESLAAAQEISIHTVHHLSDGVMSGAGSTCRLAMVISRKVIK
jgi:hypothetical protein